MRGTIGGQPGSNLTPVDIVEMTAAYAQWLINRGNRTKVVIGRDGRISGQMVSELSCNTLIAMGIDVVDLGPSTTPTVEVAVAELEAGGGIIFTASHNPKEWNALKLLNEKGEFISAADGSEILNIAHKKNYHFSDIDNQGQYSEDNQSLDNHIDKILSLRYVDVNRIRDKKFHIAVDCINSTGAFAIPKLLDKLGCSYFLINDEVNGEFAHNPEPIPENLQQLSETVVQQNANIGIAVDPDVDRLVLVNEDGSMFGEEYTLVAVTERILKMNPGNTVSNLSSTRALADLTTQMGGNYFSAAVGEVNVVSKMKEVSAVIGGEGNGGVILPELHYGRDALAGIALILSLMAQTEDSLSIIRRRYTDYVIIKNKISLSPNTDMQYLLNKVKNSYLDQRLNEEDGLKIDFDDAWVHLRKSNTEPIIRIIAEAKDQERAKALIAEIMNQIDGNT